MHQLIVTALAAAMFVGCSASQFEGAVGKSDKGDDDENVETDDDVDDITVDDPQIVAGAFLTCEPAASTEGIDPDAEMIVGCRVMTKDGPVDITAYSPAWTVKDESDTPQELKNPADLGDYDMTFVFAKAVVSTFKISVRLSEGGNTQTVSVKLEGIEAGQVTSPACVEKITFADADGATNYVDNKGTLTVDWEKGELRVTNIADAAALLSYVVTMTDGKTLSGRIFSELGVYKNPEGAKLAGDWDAVTSFDDDRSLLNHVGSILDGVPVVGALVPMSSSVVDGFPVYSFDHPGSGGLRVGGELFFTCNQL